MQFDNVYLVTDKLATIEADDIDGLSKTLPMPLPKGYAEFMTRLGVGTYCDLLRVYEPERILKEYEDVRKRWDEYFFWDNGQDVLGKQEVLKCIIFADTIDGDEIIAHADHTDRLFVLPRHDDAIYWIPESFDAPLEWQSHAGVVQHEPEFRYFESWLDREYREFFTAKELFSITDLAPYFSDFWMQFGRQVIRKPDEKNDTAEEEKVALLFVSGIGARIQLVQALPDNKRMSVRIDFDADSASEVSSFAAFLTDMGFNETSSSAAKTTPA